jgi:hypothetical protein
MTLSPKRLFQAMASHVMSAFDLDVGNHQLELLVFWQLEIFGLLAEHRFLLIIQLVVRMIK